MGKMNNVPLLRFPEFSGEWTSGVLKNHAAINPKSTKLPDRFYYIDLESVDKGELVKESIIDLATAPSRAQRLVNTNDILYQTVRPYQRNNYFFMKDQGNYVASTGYAQIRAKESPRYLFQYLHTDLFVDKVLLRCTGTSYPAINSTDLGEVPLSIPTVLEQQKIASFLTAVDDKIQQLSKKKALLEQYKKGVMQQLFSQKLRFKDDQGNEFPDWEEKKFGDVGEIVTGKTPSTNDPNLWGGDIQFITPTDIMADNKYQVSTVRTVSKTKGMRVLPVNSILFTCIASIGKMALSAKPCITNQQINSIVPKTSYSNEFVYYAILHMAEYIKSTQANSTLPIINKTEFSKFRIQIPLLTEQTKIASFLSAIDDKINSVNQQIEHTRQFKKGLLQQMFV